jgi:excisionase family DNA binding protein
LDGPRVGRQQNSWSGLPPANRPEAIPRHLPGKTTAPQRNGGGQPPAELIAHLTVALSRYLRQLRAGGGRVPVQVEALVTFLTDTAGPRPDLTVLDSWRAASDHPIMPKRLLITKSDAAELLGISLRTIERVISAGRLPLVHVEGAARVRVTDLEAYVQGLEADGGHKSVTEVVSG